MKALVYHGPSQRGWDTVATYDTFADASNTNALKVVLDGSESNHNSDILALAAST
jgi:hypothetical protein